MIVLQILMAVVAVILIVSVMLQDGDNEGITALGASTGNSETFFGKNQTSTLQGKLALITKISAGVFVVLAVVILIISARV